MIHTHYYKMLNCANHTFSCTSLIRILIIITIIISLNPVLNSQGRKIMLCKEKIRKRAGMVFTPPPPSQNYQEVE